MARRVPDSQLSIFDVDDRPSGAVVSSGAVVGGAMGEGDADQWARHVIATGLDETLFVEAGAGAGKTTALVSRIVALVVEGRADVRSIAAITFTEKAAAELRDRVRTTLERATASALAGADHERAHRCQAALDDLDEAAVATLHGFAQRILAEHPLVAGMPPRFEVLDEIESAMAFDEAFEAWIDDLLERADLRAVLVRAFALGLRVDHLRELARQLNDSWDRVRMPPSPSTANVARAAAATAEAPSSMVAGVAGVAGVGVADPGAADAADIAALVEEGRWFVSELQAIHGERERCTNDDDRLALHVDGLAPYAAAWADAVAADGQASDGRASDVGAADTALDIIELLAEEPTLKCGNGQKASWPDIGGVRRRLQALHERRSATRHRALERVLARLVPELEAFTLTEADRRRRDGRLLFHDLLVQAVRLVRGHPEVRAALSRRYTHLLVDEFQDTDPLQLELAVLLASAPETLEAHEPGPKAAGTQGDSQGAGSPPIRGLVSGSGWRQAMVDPGRLFLVGDAKQSIYRFRRADIGLFLAAGAELGARRLSLTRNFRSSATVVHWVNAVFGELIGNGDPGRQPRYEPLVVARETSAASSVVCLGGAHPSDRAIGAVRELEGVDLAATIAAAVAEQWIVGSGPDRPGRPARFGDVAVLLPTRTGLPVVERALETAGIPFRVESRTLVWSTDDLRELLVVLRCLDDPTDEVAVLAALRTPALGCGDDDLLAHVRAGGGFDYRAEPAAAPGDPTGLPVAEALAVLRRLHERRWWMALGTLVDHTISELRLYELALSHRRPRDHWRRLRFVADEARRFAGAGTSPRAGGGSPSGGVAAGAVLRRFLGWAERQADERAAVHESVLPDGDDDAVRILTVHAAKGLEFPIVVLAGLNVANAASGPATRILWDDDGSPEIRINAAIGMTSGYKALAQTEHAVDEHERLRVLYVAATRARDHLVVSLHRTASDTRSHAALLGGVLSLAATDPSVPLPVPAPDPLRAPGRSAGQSPDNSTVLDGSRAEDAGPLEALALWTVRRRRALALAMRPAAIAASSLHDDEVVVVENVDIEAPWPDAAGHRAHADDGGRRRAASAVGRAVHAVLAELDPESGSPSLEELVAEHAALEGVSDRVAAVELAARTAWSSPTVQRLVAGGRVWREVFVSAAVGDSGVVVEGFIDLLGETAEGLVIVDYKTDAIESSLDLGRRLPGYRRQIAVYATAVAQVTGRPVASAVLVFCRGPEAIEVVIADLDDAIADVVAAVDARLVEGVDGT